MNIPINTMNAQQQKYQVSATIVSNYSAAQINLVQLAELSRIYEGKLPISVLLARGCTLSSQLPNPFTNLSTSSPSLVQNATVDFTTPIKESVSAPHSSSSTLPILTEHLTTISSARNVGREISGSSFVNQRTEVLQKHLNSLQNHSLGMKALEIRKMMVTQEIKDVVRLLKNAVKPVLSPTDFSKNASIATQAWYKLSSLTVSVPDLNNSLKEVIGEIQQLTGLGSGQKSTLFLPPGSYDPQVQKQLNKCVASFEKTATKWLNNEREFTIECANQAERYIRNYHEDLRFDPTKIYDQSSWDFLTPSYKPSNPTQHQQIISHPTYSHYHNAERLIKTGKFQEASEYCSQIEPGIDYACVKEVYQKHFYENYTVEGIDKRFINNHFYLEKKHELVAAYNKSLPIPHEYNGFLAQTEKAYQANKVTLGITKTNPIMDEILYKLGQVPSNTKDRINFINSYGLSSDSANPLKCEAYHQLYSNGLLKIFNANVEWLCDIPSSIGTAQYHNERELLNNVIAHSVLHPTDAQFVKNTVDYIKLGVQNTPESAQYRSLAHSTAAALLNPSLNKTALSLANYAKPTANIHHQQLQKAAVKLIAENVSFIQKADPKNPYVTECLSAIKKIDAAYRAMEQGDSKAEFYLEKALNPALNTEVLKVDYDSHMSYFAGINQDQIVAHVQTRKDVTEVLLKNGALYELKQYQLPIAIQDFLVSQGLDPKQFEQCYGHQVQQAIHLDILRQVVKQKDLSGLALIDQSQVCKLRDLATKVTDLSRQHNALGNIEQSGMLSSFCWQIMHHVETTGKYTIDTARGIGEGIVKGGDNFVHTITHPQEAIEGFINLGKTALKAVRVHQHLNDISILKPHTENLKLEARFFEACKEAGFKDLRERIVDRMQNGTWRENIRDVTAIVVENCLVGEVIPAAGNTATTIGNLVEATGINTKALAERLAHNLKVPVTVVTTTEGIEVKIAQASENFAFKEIQSSRPKSNISSNLLPKLSREQILPKLQTYEQARNKALEIIGNVDWHTSKPHIGNVGVGEGKIVGRRWHGKKVIIRLDYDPVKGPHINVTDYRTGKGVAGNVVTIPFEGNLQTVENLLNHLNKKQL